MALPPVLLSAIGMAASNPKVQQGAERLLRDVYGRFVTLKAEARPGDTVDPVERTLSTLATREEIAASFALLQAEMENRHRRLVAMLIVVVGLQFVALLAAVAL